MFLVLADLILRCIFSSQMWNQS